MDLLLVVLLWCGPLVGDGQGPKCLPYHDGTAAPVLAGVLSQYDKSPTDATLAYRLEHGHLTEADVAWAEVFLALPECERIGERGHMRLGEHRLRYVGFDCAGVYDGGLRWMRENGVVAEADYYTAQRYIGCRCGVDVVLEPLP